MNETELDAKQIEKCVSDLAKAMESVRNDQANRDDVVIEMKQTSRARLELLAQDLQPVFEDVPDENDQFEFALSTGETPRLWIDMTSFVRMGRDRRSYEFIKDTRMGRTVIGRSDERDEMKQLVTRYIAERILMRERMIEGDWIAMKGYDFAGEKTEEPEKSVQASPETGAGSSIVSFFLWFLIGLIAGGAAMLAWAWFGDIPGFLASIPIN